MSEIHRTTDQTVDVERLLRELRSTKHQKKKSETDWGAWKFWGSVLFVSLLSWWWSMPSEKERVALQYAEATSTAREIQAEMIRERAECQADAVELPGTPEVAKACWDAFKITAQANAEIIRSNRAMAENLERRHCPGAQWCPK